MSSQVKPITEAPGAGPPFLQRVLNRIYFGPIVSNRSTWEESKKRFLELNEKILAQVENLSEEALRTCVLVPSLPGLEDSSRNWSVAMTLEHLMIVGNQMVHVIVSLSQGQRVLIKADVAKVKPKGGISGKDAVEKFRAFTQFAVQEIDSKVKDWNSQTTHIHPWFGKFKTRQWAWLLSMHSIIHYLQIKEILKELPKN